MKKKIIFAVSLLIIIIIGVLIFLFKNNTDKYIIKDLYFNNDKNQKIYSKLYRPNTDKKVPIVVYSHGLGATYRACSDYAEGLLEYNVASICIDFRGGSNKSKSDGKTTEMSIMTEYEDLLLVLDEVRKMDFIDKDKIIVMGSSQGGVLSAMASINDKDIKGTILLYPAFTLPDYINNRFPTDSDVLEEYPITNKITVGKNYVLDIRGLKMFELIKNEDKKVLIIHGSDDDVVPVSVSKRADDIYKDSKLFVIDGAGHGFNTKEANEAIIYILDYFKEIGVL